ncbi:CPBP family intramembrane metalloprotease [Altererythrobacter soli]|uniref:CPBP family intramembrane metalloprotease n=1 Tax=Croceibacterium soli TaxID=1739690 RepID=A0A6I4UWW6_9SPHN|nr:CPBP family glutamic-type intramembrane protease [Croceibacterium soli]MXP42239.1 CPBP family intramembrane metalloprotease [Croceibacterium soli]
MPDRASRPGPAAFRGLAQLLALDLLLMAVLIGGMAALTALGLRLPGHLLQDLELSLPLIALIVVGAPLGEELVFRGWLSGRPGHVGASLAILAAAVLGWAALLLLPGARGAFALLALAVIGTIAAAILLWRKRRRPPMALFARHARWFYLFSALAFASVHLANFTEGNAAILLPLTLPQFLLGLILGYARVTFGLWAGILLHALHNTLFISLVLAGAG